MNIAITGASGFVGRYAVGHFKSKGHVVTALGRDIKKLNAVFDDSVIKKETNYSQDNLMEVLGEIDVIIHLAAKRLQKDLDPLILNPYIEENILLTQNLLKASQILNINRFCQTSSISIYSALNTLPFKESQAPFAITIYGVSKLTCENLGNLFSAKTKVKVTNLRLASLFGTGEKDGVVFTDYVKLAKQKKTLEVWGKGETSIDFLYIKDVALAIEKAILPDSPHGTYNIGSCNFYSVREIAECINEVFENKGNIIFLHDKKEGGYKIYMDCTKAETELGWKPQWTLKKALEDMKTNSIKWK
jgi:UDP-glucose 4-epimerase